MEGYCNTTGCLREYMLRYFGDEAAAEHAAAAAGGTADDAEGCGNCSNCLTQFEAEDVTDMARAAVRYVGQATHALWQVADRRRAPRRQHRAHSPDASGRGPRLR